VPPEQRGHWNEIVPLSETWVGSALSSLERRKHMVAVLFGSSDATVMTHVRRTLLGMRQTLSELKVQPGEAKYCAGEALAYVAKLATGQMEMDNGRYVIHVCPSFWGEQFLGDPTYRYGTIVHEASHHWGTIDFMYGLHGSMLLARLTPSEAEMNADTFMWLVYYLNKCDGLSAGATENFASADALPPPVAPKSPCKLILEPTSATAMTVKAQCLLEVHIVSLIGVHEDGTAAFPAKKYGTLEADTLFTSSNLGTFTIDRGTTFKLLFEERCNVWEATAQLQAAKRVEQPAVLVRSLVDSQLDNAARTVGGLTVKAMKPGPLGQRVDGALQLGLEDVYLIFGGRRYKCCKHYSGDVVNFPTKLVDVTDPARLPRADNEKHWFSGPDGCTTMFGSRWHTHNSKWFTRVKSEVYDGTCLVKLDEFTKVTKQTESNFQVEVFGGVTSSTTGAECNASVRGSELRSRRTAAFYGARTCQCKGYAVVKGEDVHCRASAEMLRFFNPKVLQGKKCECAVEEIMFW